MKNILPIITTLLLLCVNILAGVCFTNYLWSNVGITSGILLLNLVICILAYNAKISKAFKISLGYFISFLTIIELVLGALCPLRLEDNWFLFAIIGLMALEIIVLTTILTTSKINIQNDSL